MVPHLDVDGLNIEETAYTTFKILRLLKIMTKSLSQKKKIKEKSKKIIDVEN